VPALLGPVVGFALGVVLAWLCRVDAPREDVAAGRARAWVAGLFAALVFAPACAYFLIFAGDWSLFYLADSRAVPSALVLVLVLVDAAAVLGGFLAGYRAARSGARAAERVLIALGAVPAVMAVAVVLAFFARLGVDGTFNQVSARFGTRPVAGGPLGYAILWMGAMIVAGLWIAGRALADRPRPEEPVEPGSSTSPPPMAPVAPAGASEARPALLGRRRR
jgi:hypothetical protein